MSNTNYYPSAEPINHQNGFLLITKIFILDFKKMNPGGTFLF